MLNKRRWRSTPFLLLAVFIIVFISNNVIANNSNQNNHILKSASELNYPPFSIVRPDGEADGFSVDLLKAVVRAIGMDITFEVGPWSEIKQKLEDGGIDVLPLVSYSEEREKLFDFTVPYLRMHGSIFVRKEENKIHDETDLKNKEVLVMRGDTAHEYAIENNLTDKLILTESFEEAMKRLSNGKHDAVIVQQVVGHQIIKKMGISNIVDVGNFEKMNLKPAGQPLTGFEQKFCIAVKNGDKELLSQLNEGLAIVIANGTYKDLYNKWFEPVLPKTNISPVTILKYALIITLPVIFLLAIFSTWYLKREVLRKTLSLQQEIEHGIEVGEDLLKSKERYRVLFEYNPIETVIVDDSSKILMYNIAKEKAGGILPDIGDIMYKDYAGKHKTNMHEELMECVKSGKQKEFVDLEYEDRFLHIRMSPLSDGAIITSIDRTETKKLQAQLQQSQKLEGIGTLAGGIAHDFNNILSPIMIHSEMVMDDLAPDDPLQHDMKEIYKAAERLRDLVKQILTIARKRAEERILLKSSLIVKDAIKFLRSTIPTTIDIHFDMKAEQDTILADPTQLNQIVMNLFTNAAHTMKEKGGLIDVTLDNQHLSDVEVERFINLKPGSYLKLSVRDTGTGIKPNIIDKIFEPYFTTKEVGEGTGLGLAIIHGIVQDYDGEITVESKVGQGTTFNIYLPLVDAEISSSDETKQENQKGTENILFVDDEKSIVDTSCKMLKKLGYTVTAKTSSIEALETFRNNPTAFDLVITDMTMPNMTGEDLAKELMAIKSGISVILCTGFSDKINGKKAKEIGISAFVMKPIVMSEMAKTIRMVLDKT